jgi:hypothetical protein
VSEALVTALVAATAAVFGGLLSAFATRSVERMRLEHSLREKTDERKLMAVQRFTNAALAWFDWIMLMAEQGLDEKILNEYNERTRERQQAYRELQLICSDDLYLWLVDEYDPLEYRVREKIGNPARWGSPLPTEAPALRREYLEMVHRTLLERFRPEIEALRNPVPRRRGWTPWPKA